jgi:uncharacterized protein
MSYDFHYFKGSNLDRLTRIKNRVRQIVDNLNWEDDKIDASKNWIKTHLFTASILAQLLALKRKQNAEIAGITGALHDLGFVVNMGNGKDHAAKGGDMARRVLKQIGDFNKEEIDLIVNAVIHHSEKDKVGNWLDELIKDVDVLDCALHGSDFSRFEYHFKRQKNVEKELGIDLSLIN